MKNFLVLKHYTITDKFFCFNEKDMSIVAKHYSKARDIVVESAKKYLHDIDEIIIHSSTVKNDQEMFKDHAELIKELYHSEDCNIVYCDLDVVFIKPTRIFGEYEDFSMESQNCGVRYYPAGGMTDAQWKIQEDYVSTWRTQFDEEEHPMDRVHLWQYEQNMFIEMHKNVLEKHNMVTPFEGVVHQVYNIPNGRPHMIADDKYTMVHCCGTSQQFNGVDLMSQLYHLSLENKYEEIHQVLSDPNYVSRQSVWKRPAPWLVNPNPD